MSKKTKKRSEDKMTPKQIQDFICGRLSDTDLFFNQRDDFENEREISHGYRICLEDLYEGVLCFSKDYITGEDLNSDYLDWLYDDEFYYAIGLDQAIGCPGVDILDITDIDYELDYIYPSSKEEMLHFALCYLINKADDCPDNNIQKDLKCLAECMDAFLTSDDSFESQFRECVIRQFAGAEVVTGKYRNVYKAWLEEFAEKKNPVALKKLGELLFEGSDLYERNESAALKPLLAYMELATDNRNGLPEGNVAAMLGEIYQNGSANDGIPQYDKAVYYHLIGLIAKQDLSMLAMGDLLYDGRGSLPKSITSALRLYTDAYVQNLEKLKNSDMDNYYPESAVRIARHAENALKEGKDLIHAYAMYLNARCGLDTRINYGIERNSDKYLQIEIDQAIEDLEEKLEIKKLESLHYDRPYILDSFLGGGQTASLCYVKAQDAVNTYLVSIMTGYHQNTLIPIPEFKEAYLAVGCHVVVNARIMRLGEENEWVEFDDYLFDEDTKRLEFFLDGESQGYMILRECMLTEDGVITLEHWLSDMDYEEDAEYFDDDIDMDE